MARSTVNKAGGTVVRGKMPARPNIQNPPSDPVKPRRVGDPTGEPKLTVTGTKGEQSKFVGELSPAGVAELASQAFPHLSADDVARIMAGPPPEDAQVTNYDDRPRFEKSAIEQLGEDPFDIDPYQEVIKADKRLPELFNFTFRGKINWIDRGRLNKEERDLWDSNVKRFHSDTFNEAASRKKTLTTKYDRMMTEFDRRKKNLDAIHKRQRAESGAPKLEEMVNDKGEVTLHVWDRDEQIYKDTGKKPKVVKEGAKKTPPDVKTAISIVMRLHEKIPIEERPVYTEEELEKDPTLATKAGLMNIFQKHLDPGMLELFNKNMDIINEHFKIGPFANKTTGAIGAKAAVGKAKTQGAQPPGGVIRIQVDGQGQLIQGKKP